MTSPCPKCGGTATTEAPAPPPHHARLNCACCGAFRAWAPRPADPADDFAPAMALACLSRVPPVALDGTPAQVRWAESIRHGLIEAARHANDIRVMVVLLSVRDASWFLANRDRTIEQLRMPKACQLELAGHHA